MSDIADLVKRAHDLDVHPYRTPQGEANVIALCHELGDRLERIAAAWAEFSSGMHGEALGIMASDGCKICAALSAAIEGHEP
jgi:hypothetical protein